MSPMRVLGEADGQYMIFQISQELPLALDKDEWMTPQEMWLSTRDMLLGKHDDMVLPMLFDRIHAVVCAQQHIDKCLEAVRAYDDRVNAQKAPDGDGYNALFQLILG